MGENGGPARSRQSGRKEAPVLRVGPRGPSIRVVRALVPILQQGGIVVLPTDTLYGLSGRFDLQAIRRQIREIKGHDTAGPMLSLVSGSEMAFRYAEPPRGACAEILLKHWPGPLTAVLRARSHVPTELCGPGDTLAFRWPGSPFLQALVGALGIPLLSTSANRAGEKTAASFDRIAHAFGKQVDALVDGGKLSGLPSTIIDLTGNEPVILREGALKIPRPRPEG